MNEPVSLREIPATVAEWVGLDRRSPFPGQSLTRFLGTANERLPEASPVLCEVEHMEHLDPRDHVPASVGAVASLVSRDRVYIRRDSGREELYDLSNDPREEVDLATDLESRLLIYRFREKLDRIRNAVTTQVAD